MKMQSNVKRYLNIDDFIKQKKTDRTKIVHFY